MYRQVPITAAVAVELMREIYGDSGRVLTRDEVVNAITAEHLVRGGVTATSNDPGRSTFKKALATLKALGEVENCGHGRWRFVSKSGSEWSEESYEHTEVEDVTDEPSQPDFSGLYLYYYPSYKTLAALKEEKRWLCKIGISGVGVLSRIASQMGTGTPELPTLGLSVSCTGSDAASLESALHAVLTARGMKATEAGGNEWFHTSPSEVCDALRWILPDLLVQHERCACTGSEVCGVANHTIAEKIL